MIGFNFCLLKVILTIFIIKQYYKLVKKLITQKSDNAYQVAQSSIDNRLPIDFLLKTSLTKEEYHGRWKNMDKTMGPKFVTYNEFKAELFSSIVCPVTQMYTVAMAIPFNNEPNPLEIGSDDLDTPNLVYAPYMPAYTRQILWNILVRNDRAEFLRDGQFRLATFYMLSGCHELSNNLRQMLADNGFFIPVLREDVQHSLIPMTSPDRVLQHQPENLTWRLVPLNEINPALLQVFQIELYFLRSNVRPVEMDHYGSSDAVGSNHVSPYISYEVRQRIQDIRINRETGDQGPDNYARNRSIRDQSHVLIFLGKIQDDEMERDIISAFPSSSQAGNNIRMNVEEQVIPAASFQPMNEQSVMNSCDQIGFADLNIKLRPVCRDNLIASTDNENYNSQEGMQTQAESQENAPQNTPVLSQISPVGVPTNTISPQIYSDQTSRAQTFTDNLFKMGPSSQRLAEAGFVYTGPDDECCCFSCGIHLGNWDKDDDPWQVHAHRAPGCPYVRQIKGEDYVKLVQQQYRFMLRKIPPVTCSPPSVTCTPPSSDAQNGNTTQSASTSRNGPTVPASLPNSDTNSPPNPRSLNPHPDQDDKKS